MAAVGKRHHGVNSVQNFGNYPVGGVEIIGRDIVPNFIKIVARAWMKSVSNHEPGFE